MELSQILLSTKRLSMVKKKLYTRQVQVKTMP